jgi:CHAT domain-containing protein
VSVHLGKMAAHMENAAGIAVVRGSRARVQFVALVVVSAVAAAVAGIWRYYSSSGFAVRHLYEVAARAPIHLRGRVVGGMPPVLARSAGGGADDRALDMQAAIATVLVRTRGATDTTLIHAAGVARLIRGDREEAVDLLRRAADGGGSPAWWSDLSAGLLERGIATDSAYDIAQALGAADHALRLDASLTEARFNRALALDHLKLGAIAAAGYDSYAVTESLPQSAFAARERAAALRQPTTREAWQRMMPRLERAALQGDRHAVDAIVAGFPQQTRTWAETEFLNDWANLYAKGATSANDRLRLARDIGESLRSQSQETLVSDAVAAIDAAIRRGDADVLSRGQTLYREGRLLYSQRRVSDAAGRFDDAEGLFRSGRSPMVLMASFYRCNVLYDTNRSDDALILIRQLIPVVPPTYRALTAQLLWTQGTILLNRGELRDALDSYELSLRGFEGLRESENAATLKDLVAVTLALTGRSQEAWQLRRTAFSEGTGAGDQWRLNFAATMAARQAIHDHDWDVAWSMFTIALDTAFANPRIRADATLWRSFAAWRTGTSPSADLSEARRAVGSIGDVSLRASEEADLRLVEGVINTSSAPVAAVDALLSVVSYANRTGKKTLLPAALMQRGLAHRQLGELGYAATDLRQAADVIERERNGFEDADVRDAMLGTASGIYQNLILVELERNDHEAMFAAAERMRSRRVLEVIRDPDMVAGAAPLDTRSILSSLPPVALIASYVWLPEGLVIITVSKTGIGAARVTTSRVDIDRLGSALREAIRRAEPDAFDHAASELYRLLISPIENEIASSREVIIVPDEGLDGIPFAALREEDGKYLIERATIIVAPSASTFIRALAAAVPRTARVLVVGDPLIDQRRFPDLARLPSAATEARAVARTWGVAALIGEEATRERLLRDAGTCDLIHIASHAVGERKNGVYTSLILAPSPGSTGELTLRDIAALRLSRRPVVILASCQSGRMTTAPGALRSLAVAFLMAGSRSVIGTIWPIDDAEAGTLSFIIHQRLAAGATPAEAVRAAQMIAARRPNRMRALQTWAAFQVYGTGL